MSNAQEVDEIITVSGEIETGYFYLENRRFEGPFSSGEEASKAAFENCNLTEPGQCRAIYHGSVQLNKDTNLREPLSDMRQINSIEYSSEMAHDTESLSVNAS